MTQQELDSGLDEIASKAVRILSETFAESGELTKEQFATARLAAGVLATWTKHRQSSNASDALTFGMISAISETQEELRANLVAALPDHPALKALSLTAPVEEEVPAEWARTS